MKNQEKFCVNKKKYVQVTKDDMPCKYYCRECGCTFWGRYHSSYSMSAVICPTCDTSYPFIDMLGCEEA